MAEIITFSTSKDLRERIDRLRGDIARSKFISRLIEDALGKHSQQEQLPLTSGQSLVRPGQSLGIMGSPKGGTSDG